MRNRKRIGRLVDGFDKCFAFVSFYSDDGDGPSVRSLDDGLYLDDHDPLTIAPMGGQIKQDGRVFQYAVMFISMPSSYVFEQPYVSREGKEYFSLEIPCY